MSYSDMTAGQVYHHLGVKLPTWTLAELWVKALNVIEIRRCLVRWAGYIQGGIADGRAPSITCMVTQQQADTMMAELENDMEREVLTRPSLRCNEGPGYDTMAPQAKRAMTEELLGIHKKYPQIQQEATGVLVPLRGLGFTATQNPNTQYAEWQHKTFEVNLDYNLD